VDIWYKSPVHTSAVPYILSHFLLEHNNIKKQENVDATWDFVNIEEATIVGEKARVDFRRKLPTKPSVLFEVKQLDRLKHNQFIKHFVTLRSTKFRITQQEYYTKFISNSVTR
jgi:hypothetical protein